MANKLKFSELLEVGLLNDGDYLNIVTTSGVNRRIKFSTLKTAVNDSVGNYVDIKAKNNTVYRVTVKAISTNEEILNGKTSDPIYVYRLPEAEEVNIDDGQFILNSTDFYETAVIEFIDNVTGVSYVEQYTNPKAALNLSALNINSWQNLESSNNEKVSAVVKTAIKLNGEALTILDGRDYTINLTLLGNSNSSLGFITSTKTVNISSLTTTKLKPNVSEVSLGVVSFMPDEDYATISNEIFTLQSGIDFNYSFNNSISSTFWHKTVVYKIVIPTFILIY